MIARLRGELIAKYPTEVVIDVNGIGFGLQISVATFEKIGDLAFHCPALHVPPCAGRHSAALRIRH